LGSQFIIAGLILFCKTTKFIFTSVMLDPYCGLFHLQIKINSAYYIKIIYLYLAFKLSVHFLLVQETNQRTHKLFSFLEKKKVSKKEKIPYMNL